MRIYSHASLSSLSFGPIKHPSLFCSTPSTTIPNAAHRRAWRLSLCPHLAFSNPSSPWPSLPCTDPSRLDLGLQAPPEHRRLRTEPPATAAHRGQPTSDHPKPPRKHPKVSLDSLSLLPHQSLAAGDGARQNLASAALLYSWSGQGPDCKEHKLPRGLNVKGIMYFKL